MYCPHPDCLPKSDTDMRLMEVTDSGFHALMWLTNMAGMVLLVHAAMTAGSPSAWTWRYIVGCALQGAGGFQVVEGVIGQCWGYIGSIHAVNGQGH